MKCISQDFIDMRVNDGEYGNMMKVNAFDHQLKRHAPCKYCNTCFWWPLRHQHVHCLVHGHFYWSTFSLHLVRAPKALRMYVLEIGSRKYYHKLCQWKETPLARDNFMVHGVSHPLRRCADFLNICPKGEVLKILIRLTILLSSSSPPQIKFH